jgi:L-serine dehydratase
VLVTSIISSKGVNIAQIRVFRKEKGVIVETDQQVNADEIEIIGKLRNIREWARKLSGVAVRNKYALFSKFYRF